MHSYPSPAASRGASGAQGVWFMILTLLLSMCCWHVRVFEHAEGCMVKLQGDSAQVSGSDVCVIDCETAKPWPGCREMKTSWGAPASLYADVGVCCLSARERIEHGEDRKRWRIFRWQMVLGDSGYFMNWISLLTEKRQKEQERKTQ